MGERVNGKAGQADTSAAGINTTTEETGTGNAVNTEPATATESGPAAAAKAPRVRNRKDREIPVLNLPVEPAAPPEEKTQRKAKPAKADPIITAAIVAMTGSAMAMTGKMLGDEKTWTPTTSELMGIAEPAARIIERLNATAAVSKYADYVALGVGLATIILPRVLITQSKKPKVVKSHAKKSTTPYPTNTETGTLSSPNVEAGKTVSQVNPADAPANDIRSEIFLGDE